MSQSLANILIHIVFSTKNREAKLSRNICQELYAYIATILKQHSCHPYKIGGIEDHIHILCSLSKTISIAKLVEEIKTSSSKWIKTKGNEFINFSWQNGYGAFSISPAHIKPVYSYIENQEKHHVKFTYRDELKKLLNKYSIDYDERYLWN